MKNSLKNMSTRDKVLLAINPTVFLISKGAEKAIEKFQTLSDSGSVDDLRNAALRQEITDQVEKSKARIAQEIAIAQRIHTAEEVEIEEFYDVGGGGNLGITLTEGSITGSADASGHKVTKRIYRFKGWHEGAFQVLEQYVNSPEED